MTRSFQRYRYVTALILWAFASVSWGQSSPQVTQYMFTTMSRNPGFAGLSGGISAVALHRQQWYGADGNPQVTLVSLDSPIPVIRGGLGLSIGIDQLKANTATSRFTTVDLSYSYHLSLGEGVLGIGLQGGFNNGSFKKGDFRPPTSDPDPSLDGKEDASDFLFNLSAGLYYQVADRYEVGISMGNLTQPRSEDLSMELRRSMNISASYNLSFDALPILDLIPSVLVKTDFSAFQADVNMMALFDKRYWGGITYRVGDAIAILGGIYIKDLQIGVAYDIATSWMSRQSKIGGGFEVLIKYNFRLNIDRMPRSYKNSRYL